MEPEVEMEPTKLLPVLVLVVIRERDRQQLC